jgi:two-component system, sensor histidine kinase LadS
MLDRRVGQMKYYFFLFSILTLFFVGCQPETKNVDKTDYFIFEDSTQKINSQEAWQIFKTQDFRKQNSHSFNPGFTTSNFWVVVKPGSEARGAQELEIGTSQINHIEFYQIENDKPVVKYITGDHYPYSTRPVSTLNFNFPVVQNNIYLLKIDKRNESLQLTFVTKPEKDFVNETIQSSLVIGIFSGVIILMLIFGIYLFIISREFVYLFYVLYVTFGWIYVLANLGYGYKYLWPDIPFFSARARPLSALFTIGLSLNFLEYYAGKPEYRWLQRTVRILTLVSYFLAFLGLLPGRLELKSSTLGYYWQALIPALVGVYLICILTTLIQKIANKNRMAIFYLLSITPIAVFTTIQLTYYSGGVNISSAFWKNYGTATGYVMEAVILTFGLVYRFNNYRLEKEQLLIRMNQQQIKYTKAIITTQETERRQLADQLHDVAGSLLSAAKLNLSSIREKNLITNPDAQRKLETAEYAVTDISEMLRNLSHAISPVMLDKIGFKQSVEKIATIFNASDKIKVETEIVGFEEDQPSMHEKYSVLYGILYELLNNISKHAQATNALIQLVEHDESVVLMVEDNGKGLNITESEDSKTHGLAAIRSKIHYLNGNIIFDKALPTGLIVTIEIPKE